MKHRSLTLCFATALLLPLASPPTRAAPPLRPIPLDSLSAALSPDAHPATSDAWVAHGLSGRLVWVDEADLTHAAERTRVLSALDAGRAVLVTGEHASSRGLDVFGFQADTRRAVYLRTPAGKLEVASVADEVGPTEAASMIAEWIERHTPRPKRFAALLAAPRASWNSTYVPRLDITNEKRFAGGRQIAYDITVTRDVRPGRDDKVLSVKTRVMQKPDDNGALGKDGFGADEGYYLFIPLRYDVSTSVAPVGGDVTIQLEGLQPVNGQPTAQLVTSRLWTESGGGSSVPANIVDFLTSLPSGAVGALGKLPTLFPGIDKVVEDKIVSMRIDDYGIETQLADTETVHQVTWSFGLSSDIAHDPKRFSEGYNRLGYERYSMKKATSMMRSANVETASSWRVPGKWQGKLDITTRSTVVNRVFFDASLPTRRFDEALPDDPASDISFTLRVDLDSPYLTRQPSVRLQSMQGEGLCLTQPDPSAPTVTLQACGMGTSGREQQWYLDTDSTYRNRASGACLTTDLTDGAIRAEACRGAVLNQQWMWSADRLHSKTNGGDRWRLHLRQGVPNAMFDPDLHDAIRPNRHHALLPPWWSYPEKPNPGDTAPNPNGGSHLVYEEFRHHRRVSDDQRWQIKPVMDAH